MPNAHMSNSHGENAVDLQIWSKDAKVRRKSRQADVRAVHSQKHAVLFTVTTGRAVAVTSASLCRTPAIYYSQQQGEQNSVSAYHPCRSRERTAYHYIHYYINATGSFFLFKLCNRSTWQRSTPWSRGQLDHCVSYDSLKTIPESQL